MKLEDRIVKLIKQWEEERRLADKRIKQAIATTAKEKVYLDADQENIIHQTWTLVNVNTVVYDIGNNFDTVNHRFVTSMPGYYLIIGNISWKSLVADKQYITGIYTDGSLKAVTRAIAPTGDQYISSSCSTIEYIAKSKNIELKGYHNAGVDTIDIMGGSATYTYIAVHLLSI